MTDAAGKAAKIEWVGRKIDDETKKSGDPTVTLFFEISLPGGLEAVSLRNGILQNLFEDQLNLLLLLRNGSKKVPMQFRRGDGAKSVLGRSKS